MSVSFIVELAELSKTTGPATRPVAALRKRFFFELLQAASSCKQRAAASSELLQAASCCKQRAAASSEQLQAASCCKQRAAASSEQLQAASCCKRKIENG